MSSLPEIDKIRYYLHEGERLYTSNPKLVGSREFFELWEDIHKPEVVRLTSKTIYILDQKFDLESVRKDSVAYYCWDDVENSAVLAVEDCENMAEKIIIGFKDGAPSIQLSSAKCLKEHALSDSEKFESVMDVIELFRIKYPGKNIKDINKKQFMELLSEVPEQTSITLRTFRKLVSKDISDLVHIVSEDMAEDELCNQLSLPLNGNYAMTSEVKSEVMTNLERSDMGMADFKIPPRTRWSILREISFLCDASKLAMENEKNFTLRLSDSEVITNNDENSRDIAVALKVDPDTPLTERDLLKVYIDGDHNPIGTFLIDIHDCDTLYGRLRCDFEKGFDDVKKKLYALPRKSPRSYLFYAMRDFVKLLEDNTEILRGAIGPILGLETAFFHDGVEKDYPEHLDASQAHAWSCSINGKNPVVSIQGPPGTGKTAVLEQVLRKLCSEGKRVLVSAPSNTAVDNICRKVFDLPVLRLGSSFESVARDVSAKCWHEDLIAIERISKLKKENDSGIVFAGTHVGILRSGMVLADVEKNDLFDVLIFDEAGMARMEEFILCSMSAKRVILFGDQKQLPPFPLPAEVIRKLTHEHGCIPKFMLPILLDSSLEWLATVRKFPTVMLQRSYRCHNPRLLHFSSTLFYGARVKASDNAEYYQWSYDERQRRFPNTSLKLYDTGKLPYEVRKENLVFEGGKPGLENKTEATLCVNEFYKLLDKFPLEEITIIAPYRRQIKLIRELISIEKVTSILQKNISSMEWKRFVNRRISTVDSFQGGESDAVIICYVRSNKIGSVGFVSDPNRVNVAHTRCRYEMIIIGDIHFLKKHSQNNIFLRMEKAIKREGQIVSVTKEMLQGESLPPEPEIRVETETKNTSEKNTKPKTETASRKSETKQVTDETVYDMIQPDLF